jgi:hypothetical protein
MKNVSGKLKHLPTFSQDHLLLQHVSLSLFINHVIAGKFFTLQFFANHMVPRYLSASLFNQSLLHL